MKILITGTAKGIGKAIAERYLSLGHKVHGIDVLPSNIGHPNYHHYIADVRDVSSLPEILSVEVLVSNAGTQNGEDDIGVNLQGAMNVAEKYAFQPRIRSVLFNASASARSGFEFPAYVASKAGLVGYMKNVAVRLAPYGAVANSLSLGGVLTESNAPVMEDAECWEQIMKATPLKKWMSLEEVADWVIFLTLTNRSMSGQDVLVDNGENDLNCTFVWPKK
ncbi:MAG: SDR family oxidoreductase [Bacilli bacterium]|nr:SDR family oxidoreductase [Bacilli bacterium]